jgi:hypothetical protein
MAEVWLYRQKKTNNMAITDLGIFFRESPTKTNPTEHLVQAGRLKKKEKKSGPWRYT